jgi:hypothetical protein
VSTIKMEKKSFKITCSLKEGYLPTGRLFTFNDAENLIAQWMSKRLTDGQPVINGLLQAGSLFFPAPDKSPEMITISPSVIFAGELSSEEDVKRSNEEVKWTLNSLAEAMKSKLLQESVYVIFMDEHWCI